MINLQIADLNSWHMKTSAAIYIKIQKISNLVT